MKRTNQQLKKVMENLQLTIKMIKISILQRQQQEQKENLLENNQLESSLQLVIIQTPRRI